MSGGNHVAGVPGPTRRRRYYLAVFGDPALPGRVTVESGGYGADVGWPADIAPGDAVLLYCTASYAEYPKSVPGVGVVVSVDARRRAFAYRYVALTEPLPLASLRRAFSVRDRERLGNIRFNNHWLFRIAAASYRRAVAGRVDAAPSP